MQAENAEEPPGDVSNQMPEEPEVPTDDERMSRRRPGPDPGHGGDDEGSAGEGSQSTGHPEGAG
jgi:N-acetylmuramoyl-L-alanine amidase